LIFISRANQAKKPEAHCQKMTMGDQKTKLLINMEQTTRKKRKPQGNLNKSKPNQNKPPGPKQQISNSR